MSTPLASKSRRREEEMYVGKYKLLKTIGKGNFAKVKLARHLPTSVEVGYIMRFELLQWVRET